MSLFSGNYRARRGGSAFHSVCQESHTPATTSTSNPIPWEHEQKTRNLKNLFYDVCEEKRILKRRCEELSQDKKLLKRHFEALSGKFHTAEQIAEELRRDTHELRCFKSVALRAQERSNELEGELQGAAQDLALQRGRLATRDVALCKRIETLACELTSSHEEQRALREDSARQLAALRATKDDHIAALEAELSRVKREHEACAKHQAQDAAQRKCIKFLMDRLNEHAPYYVLGATKGEADAPSAAQAKIDEQQSAN